MTARSEQELRDSRRRLFEAFPRTAEPDAILHFQSLLAEEILRTENEQQIEESQLRKLHLRAVRLYGDGVAHRLLSAYAIRQLSRNSGKPPNLIGQGAAFQLVKDCAAEVARHGVPPLLADLTNVVRNGDLILCLDPNSPRIVECKSSKVKDARFERQGRRGRQLARFESIQAFLDEGRGRIFGEENERITVEIAHTPRFSFSTVNAIVKSALAHKPLALTPSPDEFYAAALEGETADVSAALANLKHKKGDHIAIGRSLDPLQSGVWETPPPVLWKVDDSAKWALMEGDVTVSRAVRVETFVGLARGDTRVESLVHPKGKVPWAYAIVVGEERVTVLGNVILDVVYGHQTLESAGEMLLEQAEKAAALIRGVAQRIGV